MITNANGTTQTSFERWALSYSGMDGGTLRAGGHWLCGIEFGGKYDDLKKQITQPQLVPPFVKANCIWDDFLKYQYNQKLAKLYAVICGKDLSDWLNHSGSVGLCTDLPNANTFKLNLYPIACQNESEELWTRQDFEATKFPTKAAYKAWCQTHRFPQFRQLVSTYRPAFVLCTGSSYRKEFLLAFGGPELVFSQSNSARLLSDGQKVEVYVTDDTTIVVIPFLGRPLNSDKILAEVGTAIREMLSEVGKAA